MKWKDLSLKERKQIYDSVRVNNPDATYFDIKEQFDSIPTYDLFMPTDGSVETLEKVDKAYGTNYKKAASAIAFQDMANKRRSY